MEIKMTRLPNGQPGYSYAGQGVFARVRKRMEVGLIEINPLEIRRGSRIVISFFDVYLLK